MPPIHDETHTPEPDTDDGPYPNPDDAQIVIPVELIGPGDLDAEPFELCLDHWAVHNLLEDLSGLYLRRPTPPTTNQPNHHPHTTPTPTCPTCGHPQPQTGQAQNTNQEATPLP